MINKGQEEEEEEEDYGSHDEKCVYLNERRGEYYGKKSRIAGPVVVCGK